MKEGLTTYRKGYVQTMPLAAGVDNSDPGRSLPRQKITPEATPITSFPTPATPFYLDNSNIRHRHSRCQLDEDVWGRQRSDSSLSRSSSRQSKYHDECTPRLDPLLVIGSRTRRDFIEGKQRDREYLDRRRRRPYSGTSSSSLMRDGTRRESVVHLTYSGREDLSENNDKEVLLQRSQSVLSRVTMSMQGDDVLHREYDVVEEDLQSLSRATPCYFLSNSFPMPRSGFLYQQLGFRELTDSVPYFVRQHSDKTGRLTTESFILKVNYLRRRRAIGEASTATSNNNIVNKPSRSQFGPGTAISKTPGGGRVSARGGDVTVSTNHQ